MPEENTIISLFNQVDQKRLIDFTVATGDEFQRAALNFRRGADGEYAAEKFSRFVKLFVKDWKAKQGLLDDGRVPQELVNLYATAKDYISDLGFEYHWDKLGLSKQNEEEYRVFEEKLRKDGVEFSNIVINKSPIEGLDCFLDYGEHCEVFFFKDGEKRQLKTFDDSNEAKETYRQILLSKPEYFLRKIHYKWDDDKTLALHYAKVLGDEISYDILENNTQLTSEKMAYDFSCFFWQMIDLSAEDYHAKRKVAGLELNDCEFLFHSIGGFVISSGYSYQWYRDEGTPLRIEAVANLKVELEEAGVDMSKIIINHEPQDDCYCFLDYGDHHDFFYQQDDEELKPEGSYKIRDFDEAIAYFKNWVKEELLKA